MSISYQNRRNYRMRSNMTPPPVCNPKSVSNQVFTVHAQTTMPVPGNTPSNVLNTTPSTTPIPNDTPPMAESPLAESPLANSPLANSPLTTNPNTANAVLPNQQPPLIKDITYLNGLYSENVRTIQAEIQKEFDRLEYEGSFIYDESPDKNTLFYFALSIYEKIAPQTEITTRYPQGLALKSLQDELANTPNYGQLPGVNSPIWLLELIQVLIYNELIYRRYLKRTLN